MSREPTDRELALGAAPVAAAPAPRVPRRRTEVGAVVWLLIGVALVLAAIGFASFLR